MFALYNNTTHTFTRATTFTLRCLLRCLATTSCHCPPLLTALSCCWCGQACSARHLLRGCLCHLTRHGSHTDIPSTTPPTPLLTAAHCYAHLPAAKHYTPQHLYSTPLLRTLSHTGRWAYDMTDKHSTGAVLTLCGTRTAAVTLACDMCCICLKKKTATALPTTTLQQHSSPHDRHCTRAHTHTCTHTRPHTRPAHYPHTPPPHPRTRTTHPTTRTSHAHTRHHAHHTPGQQAGRGTAHYLPFLTHYQAAGRPELRARRRRRPHRLLRNWAGKTFATEHARQRRWRGTGQAR